MGLFTLHNCCASCSLDYLKSKLESKGRLPIPEFSGYDFIPKMAEFNLPNIGIIIKIELDTQFLY